MFTIASIESLLGSIWFAGLTCLIGYIGGCVFPVSKLKSKISG